MASGVSKFFHRTRSALNNIPTALPSTVEKFSAISPAWQKRRAANRLTTLQLKAQAAVQAQLLASYESATGSASRYPRETFPRSEFAQLLMQNQRDEVVEASRNTYRGSKLMRGFITRAADNIIGTGLEVVPKTKDKGYNAEQKAAFAEHTRAGGGWEVTGRWSLFGAQRTAFISAIRDGDLFLYNSDDGWQLFDGNQCGTPYGWDASGRIINGVEFSPIWKPTRYWIGDWSRWGYLDSRTAKGLRADKILHIGNHGEFVSEARPLPQYQAQLGLFEDVDKYLNAVVIRALGDACIMGEINSPHANAINAVSAAPSAVAAQNASGEGGQEQRHVELAPGMFINTKPGEKFQLHSTNSPNGNVPDFIRIKLRLLGFPIGLPLELGLMDFTETNFAAAKMSISQATLTHYFFRYRILDDQLIRPVYEDFVANKSPVKLPRTVQGRADAYELTEPRIPWLEPLKEANALNTALKGGWDSLIRIAHDEMKREWSDIVNERAEVIAEGYRIIKERNLPESMLPLLIGEAQTVADVMEPPTA